jgi:hypothetical protein
VEIDPGQDIFSAVGMAVDRLVEMPENREIHELESGLFFTDLLFPVVQALDAAKMEDVLLSFGMDRGGLGNEFLTNVASDLFFFVFYHFSLPFRQIDDAL